VKRIVGFLTLCIFLHAHQPRLMAQAQSQLLVSTADQKVHLAFTLDGDSKKELAQSLAECKPVEVRYIAELRKQRTLWPDLRFARTTVRNRVVCDAQSQGRTLSRVVDGSIVASATEMDQAEVLAFMSETGDVSAFQDVKFPSYSYSVQVISILVTSPDDELRTGVLAQTRFEIR
jgi:hypothetical protein